MIKKIFLIFISSFPIISCSNSAEMNARKQRIDDSIAKAEALLTEQEAMTAERMIDSVNALANDTSKH